MIYYDDYAVIKHHECWLFHSRKSIMTYYDL